MSAFDDIRKQRTYKSIDMNKARINATQRAMEQRQIVLNNITKDHFLDLDVNSRAWSKVYGTQSEPVQVAPFTLSSRVDFEKPVNSINMENGATIKAGSPGIASLASFNAAIPGDYFNIGAADRKKDIEYVIAEFPLGVGTDLAFLKPRFPQGEVELGTTFSGFLRFRNEIGGASNDNNSGYMNNGIIRFKVLDQIRQTSNVILEVAAELFNAASQGVKQPGSPPGIDYNLKTQLYPNFVHSDLTTSGSTLQVTVSRIFEGTFVSDDGISYDIGLTSDFCPLDGENSRFYIDTKRLQSLGNSQM